MNNSSNSNIKNLVALSKVDVAIAHIENEKKQLQSALDSSRTVIKSLKDDITKKQKTHDERKDKYTKEDKVIREEEEKLKARRKALASFGNYKVQQVAEKEIEHAGKLLSARDEPQIALLEEVDKLNKEIEALTAKLEKEQTDFEKLTLEATETVMKLEDRFNAKNNERQEALALVESGDLNWYDKIRSKYPLDPVVALDKNACGGCFMRIPQQVIVQIIKGSPLTRCPGCGRIVAENI